MAEQQIVRSPALTGGVSRQPKHGRFPTQVEEAQNVIADPSVGLVKRPGSRLLTQLASPEPAAASQLRLHTINRDRNERYQVIYGRDASSGNMIIRVFEDDGTAGGNEATVTIDAAADAYLDLNDAEAEDLVLRTTADTTFIINTTVQAQTQFTDDFTVTETFDDVDEMERHRGTNNAYYAIGSPATRWFRYVVDGKNVAQLQCRTTTDFEWYSPNGNWNDPEGSGGAFEAPFRLGFVAKRRDLSITNGAWDNTAKTLTKAGAFADYMWIEGDRIALTTGTSLPGNGDRSNYYAYIVSRDSDDQITLGEAFRVNTSGLRVVDSSINGTGNQTDWNADGIYHYYEASVLDDQYENIDAVAAAWTDNFQTGVNTAPSSGITASNYGIQDIGLNWTEASSTSGYFTIVAPFRGSEADDVKIIMATAGGADTGTDNLGDSVLTNTGSPFYSPESYAASGTEGTVTAGTGTPSGLGELLIPVDIDDPDTRWVEVSEPGSADANLNKNTLPVRMNRTTLNPLAFEVVQIDWDTRASGNNTNNPSPDLFKASTREGLIESITAASPGVVTSTGHGLTTGDVIQIIDTDSTPILDGERTVTRIDDDTFSVGVNTSGAGTADTGSWRQGGTKIGDIAVFQNRIALIGGEYVALSNSGNLFDFYADDATNATDADPIDLRVGGTTVADLFALVPFRTALVLFSTTGQQFELSADGPITPTSARIEASTDVPITTVRPVRMGSYIYFIDEAGDGSVVHEYAFNDRVLTSVTDIVTTHAKGFVPTGMTTLTADSGTQRLCLLAAGDDDIYVYSPYWSGVEKVQSAWVSWPFREGYALQDAQFLADRLYLLVKSGGKFRIEWIPTDPIGNETNFPYEVHGDCQVKLTGTLSTGDTVFDLSGYNVTGDTDISALVKGNDFTDEEGETITSGITGSGSDVTLASSDETDGDVILYIPMVETVEFTRPFAQLDGGRPDVSASVLVREASVSYLNGGPFTFASSSTGYPIRNVTEGSDGTVAENGVLRASPRNMADHLTMSVITSSPTPLTITSIEYLIESTPSIRRGATRS